MKNILLFTPFVNQGDLHRYVESLALGLEKIALARGWRFDVLGQQYDEVGLAIRYPASFHFTPIKPNKPLPPHPHLLNFLRVNAGMFVTHLREVADDYDLIFCPNGYWSTAAEWDIPTPCVTLVPDLGWDVIEMGEFLDMFLSESACRIAESAACSVFTGEFFRQLGIERYSFKPENTALISNCAETYAYPFTAGSRAVERVRINYNLPQRYLLMHDAAGFRGLDVGLIGYALAKKLALALPPLVVSGSEIDAMRTTPYGARIYELITVNLDLKIGTDVLLAGAIAPEDEAALFGGATMTIVPSRMEGDISGAIFAAMQARSPVIHSDLPLFTARLGTDEQYALSFPVDDVETLARQIDRAWSESPYEHDERTEAAFQWAQQYRTEQWVGSYADVFEQVMNRKAGESDAV